MPLFGAHLSVAGGLHNAVAAAVALRCDSLQIFTKNANVWAVDPLTGEEVAGFRRAAAGAELREIAAHDSYLINLASPDYALFRKSVGALATEMERAEALGLGYLVVHPGAHVGSGEEAGLDRVAAGLDEVHARCAGFTVRLLVETTAGQGTTLGRSFEQLAAIFDRAKDADRMDVCFDTCHVFAAGYSLATGGDYAATFQQFDDLIGLSRLKLFHVNDSAKPLGSRVDRHAGIGLGEIGLDAFRRLVNDPRFAHLPMVLETPKEDGDGNDMDPVNLQVLRDLLDGPVARAG
jgi:deoxyribonuclease-4